MLKKVHPYIKLLIGLLFILVFYLFNILYVKVIITVLFIILALLNGRRIRILRILIIFSCIVFMNILIPKGKIYFNVLNFCITEGALFAGINKGITLICLIYISMFAVSKDLKLPGIAGEIFLKIFFYFNELSKMKGLFKKGKFINNIDNVLFQITVKQKI